MMTDYLLSAKTLLDSDRITAGELDMVGPHALISIAESLAQIADQPSAIQIINSRLRGIENDLDELDECLHKHLPKDAEPISAAGGSNLSHFQAESVDRSTPEDSEASERQLVEEVARAIHATYMIVNPEVSPWVELPDDGDEYRHEARSVLAVIRKRYMIEPKARP